MHRDPINLNLSLNTQHVNLVLHATVVGKFRGGGGGGVIFVDFMDLLQLVE